jgi:hypothetical protein
MKKQGGEVTPRPPLLWLIAHIEGPGQDLADFTARRP